MAEKPKPFLVDFWTAAHAKLEGKSSMGLLIRGRRRSRMNLHLSSDYFLEYRIGRHDRIRNKLMDFKRIRRRSSPRKVRLKRGGVKEKCGIIKYFSLTKLVFIIFFFSIIGENKAFSFNRLCELI